MGDDRPGDAGAMHMRTILAVECIEARGNRTGEFRMIGVDSGIDHRNGDVAAVRQRMRFRQPQLCQRILRRVAFGR